MKDKSWIIIVIMAIALAISIGYSIYISQKNNQMESTVTTTSIIEMTATTVTIKNTLTGTGTIEYKESEVSSEETVENEAVNEDKEIIEDEAQEETEKSYQIVLSIEDKDLEKAEVGQDVEITVKKDEETLNYVGKVIEINENTNNKSTLDVEITNPDENVEENMTATCTVITEKAENVVGLPIEAIQINDDEETFVDVVQDDGTTKSVIIETGISDDYYVEITSGLSVGERVQIVKSTTTVVNEENNSSILNGLNNINLTSKAH